MLLLIILHLYIYKYIYVICEGIFITAKYYSQLSSIILNCATKKTRMLYTNIYLYLSIELKLFNQKDFMLEKFSFDDYPSGL